MYNLDWLEAYSTILITHYKLLISCLERHDLCRFSVGLV